LKRVFPTTEFRLITEVTNEIEPICRMGFPRRFILTQQNNIQTPQYIVTCDPAVYTLVANNGEFDM